MIADGRIDSFVTERCASCNSGIGKEIVSGKATLESLSEYALKMGEVPEYKSRRQELLESILNQVLFS